MELSKIELNGKQPVQKKALPYAVRKNKEAVVHRQPRSTRSKYQGEEAARWSAFGSWVRGRRRSLGISQSLAASRAGIAGNHWSRIENGKSGIRYDKVEAIAHALELHPSRVFEASGYTPPAGFSNTEELIDTEKSTTVRSYLVAKRCDRAMIKHVLVASSHNSLGHNNPLAEEFRSAMFATRQDIEKLEASLARLANNQQRQDEFAQTVLTVLRLVSTLLEGRPAAVLKKLLNHRSGRASFAIRTL